MLSVISYRMFDSDDDLCMCVQGLSRCKDGLLVTEMDLNLCRQVKDKWGFRVSWDNLEC